MPSLVISFQGKEIYMSFAGERKSDRQKGVSSFPRTHAGELMVVAPKVFSVSLLQNFKGHILTGITTGMRLFLKIKMP